MKRLKAKISWSKKAPLKMAGIAHGIAGSLTSNPNFPTPVVKPGDLETAAIRVENAWANRKNGQAGKDELNNSVDALEMILYDLTDYVDSVAKSNETIIHSAGFETTNSSSARIAKPATLLAPALTSLPSGIIKAKAIGVTDARLYSFILVVDAPFTFTINNGIIEVPANVTAFIINSTKAIVHFTGLPALKSVSVAVITYNSSGNSGLSPVGTSSTLA